MHSDPNYDHTHSVSLPITPFTFINSGCSHALLHIFTPSVSFLRDCLTLCTLACPPRFAVTFIKGVTNPEIQTRRFPGKLAS
jgi:hypothetical protein